MTKQELIDILKDNKLGDKFKISASSLANIMKFVNVSLEIDRRTLDYYYKIDINSLIHTDFPREEYEVLKEQGWSISNDRNNVVIYLRN